MARRPKPERRRCPRVAAADPPGGSCTAARSRPRRLPTGPETQSLPSLVPIGGVGTCSPTRLLLNSAEPGNSKSVHKECQTRMPAKKLHELGGDGLHVGELGRIDLPWSTSRRETED